MKFIDPYYKLDPTKPHNPVAQTGRDLTGRFTAKLTSNTMTDDNFPIDSVWWSRYARGTLEVLDALRGEEFRFAILPDKSIFSWRMICEMYEAALDAIKKGKSDDEAIQAAHDHLKRKQIETAKKLMDDTMADPTATAIDQSSAVDEWMTLNWENIPEIQP